MKAGFLAAVIVGQPGTVTRESGGCKWVITDTADPMASSLRPQLTAMGILDCRLQIRRGGKP